MIPNWNGKHLLEKSTFNFAAAPRAEVILADDASQDGSVALVKEKYPGVVIVENKHRKGFAGNVNSGVARATGEIVVLLNTDVRPERGFLDPLLSRFSDDPMVAGVGCLEKSHDLHGVVLRGRGIARWEKGYFIHRRGDVDSNDTAWVSGGSGAFRLSVWKKLGGMDTLYNPFYWEDIDFHINYSNRDTGLCLKSKVWSGTFMKRVR